MHIRDQLIAPKPKESEQKAIEIPFLSLANRHQQEKNSDTALNILGKDTPNIEINEAEARLPASPVNLFSPPVTPERQPTPLTYLSIKDFDDADNPHASDKHFDRLQAIDFLEYTPLLPSDFPQVKEHQETPNSLNSARHNDEEKSPFLDSSDTLKNLESENFEQFILAYKSLVFLGKEKTDELLDKFIPRGLIKHVNYLCSVMHNGFSLESLTRHVKTALQHDQNKILERLACEGGLYCVNLFQHAELMRLAKGKPLCQEFLKDLDFAFNITSPQALINFQKKYPCAIFWKSFHGYTLLHHAITTEQRALIHSCIPTENQRLIGINVFEERDMRMGLTPLLMAANLGNDTAVADLMLYAGDHSIGLNTISIDGLGNKSDCFYMTLTAPFLGCHAKIEDDLIKIMRALSDKKAKRVNQDLVWIAANQEFCKAVIFLISRGYQFDRPRDDRSPFKATGNKQIKELLVSLSNLFNAQATGDFDTVEHLFEKLYVIFGDHIFNVTSYRHSQALNHTLKNSVKFSDLLGFGMEQIYSDTSFRFMDSDSESLFNTIRKIVREKRLASMPPSGVSLDGVGFMSRRIERAVETPEPTTPSRGLSPSRMD